MSFLRRLFGRATPEELEREGAASLAAGDLGEAKLTLERALERLPAADTAARERIDALICQARDGIARGRVAEAERLRAQEEPELARAELEGALEVVADEEQRRTIQRALDDFEQAEAVIGATAVELSEADRRAIMASQWSDAQADEFTPYEDALLDALVWLGDEEHERGREAIEALCREAEAPCYLLRELGAARALAGDIAGATEAFRSFLAALPETAPEELVLLAQHNLAALAASESDMPRALEHLWAAVEAAPEDVRAYKVLGSTLRAVGRAAEAVEVLTEALNVMGERPDWQLFQELGLAHLDAGQKAQAKDWLEQVIEWLKGQKLTDFPPQTSVALAQLYEEEGRLERAADMYRLLTMGSHREGHAVYYREAARLLRELGLGAEARRMLTRAEALLEDDPGALEAVRADIAALESS